MLGMTIVWMASGLVLLVIGAEALVRGASGIARALGLSPLLIGLTVVAFGTSSPELAVSLKAAASGFGDMAIGNVVGSNIFNAALILGVSAMVAPLAVNVQVIRLDMRLLLGVSTVFVGLCLFPPGISRWEAALLFLGVLIYTFVLIRLARKEPANQATPALEIPLPPEQPGALPLNAAKTVAGLLLLTFGARMFVENATVLAERAGMSDAVIGLTIVAAGTSLPELATSVVAAARRQTDVAVGNIVGSNLFNLLGVAGLTGLVVPLHTEGVRALDFGAMLATSAMLLPLMRSGFRVVRWEGALLIFAYLVYLALRWP